MILQSFLVRMRRSLFEEGFAGVPTFSETRMISVDEPGRYRVQRSQTAGFGPNAEHGGIRWRSDGEFTTARRSPRSSALPVL